MLASLAMCPRARSHVFISVRPPGYTFMDGRYALAISVRINEARFRLKVAHDNREDWRDQVDLYLTDPTSSITIKNLPKAQDMVKKFDKEIE